MRRHEDAKRKSVEGRDGRASPPQRYRESAEERGLAAAARLAAAVAAATGGPDAQARDLGKFRLRRHSAGYAGCRTAPGQPAPGPSGAFHAWKAPENREAREAREAPQVARDIPQNVPQSIPREVREAPREAPREHVRRERGLGRDIPEPTQVRVAPGEVAKPRGETSPLRPRLARAQSARRPTRLDPPARARSADPRRRHEAAFVPEKREEADSSMIPEVQEAEARAAAGTGKICQGAPSPRLHTAARRSTGQILTAAAAAVAGRRASTGNMSLIDQQPTPFKNLTSKVFSGSYSVAKFLGRGASASVWEAVRSDNEQRVAVKVFDQGQRDKRQAHREMKVLSRVRHPRIVEAFEVIETPRYAQLVCELVDGESLRAFSHRQPCHKLPEQVARLYYRQVVEGVSVCHERLVAHRDLKLENVLLDKSREGVKIIDFGFAAHVPSKETKLKAFCGTPSYMAPEIIRGEGYSGFAADVWALGVVIFALLSGTLPFSARTEMQLYARIRRGTFTFPDCFCEAQKRLIKGVMRKDAAARPSASAMLQHAWVAGRDADLGSSAPASPRVISRVVEGVQKDVAKPSRPQTAPTRLKVHGYPKSVTNYTVHLDDLAQKIRVANKGALAFGGS
mmetsp:Transcript_60731/g.142062  ORF Transcript_60731/g.142062 Transcript_60731/m.142062 type:complete len:625 (+) Transcript_60731:68-1942(+)